MIKLKINFMSKAIMRNVHVNVLIPRATMGCKSLYLLHGMYGGEDEWLQKTKLINYLENKNLAVIMPCGENSFYVDNNFTGEQFGVFIGKELVNITRELLPLSPKKEHTFIAGLSMGGFGAVRNGLKYSETFSHIAGFSSALIMDRLINPDPNAEVTHMNAAFYNTIFDGADALKTSDKNPEVLIKKLLEQGKDIPEIYLTCGTEDFLLEDNRKFVKFLQENNVKHTYTESMGAHDWVYWDKQIKKLMGVLPL